MRKPPAPGTLERIYASSNLFGRKRSGSQVPQVLSVLHPYLAFSDVIRRILVKGFGPHLLSSNKLVMVRAPGSLATSKRKSTKVRRPGGSNTSQNPEPEVVPKSEEAQVEGHTKDVGNPGPEGEAENLSLTNQSIAKKTRGANLRHGRKNSRAARPDLRLNLLPVNTPTPYAIPSRERGAGAAKSSLKTPPPRTQTENPESAAGRFDNQPAELVSLPLLRESAKARTVTSSLVNALRTDAVYANNLGTRIATGGDKASKYTLEPSLPIYADFQFRHNLNSDHRAYLDKKVSLPESGRSFPDRNNLGYATAQSSRIKTAPYLPPGEIRSESKKFTSRSQFLGTFPGHHHFSIFKFTKLPSLPAATLFQSAHDVQRTFNVVVYQLMHTTTNSYGVNLGDPGRLTLALMKGDSTNSYHEVFERAPPNQKDNKPLLNLLKEPRTAVTEAYEGSEERVQAVAYGDAAVHSTGIHRGDYENEHRRDLVQANRNQAQTFNPLSNPALISRIANARATGGMMAQAASSVLNLGNLPPFSPSYRRNPVQDSRHSVPRLMKSNLSYQDDSLHKSWKKVDEILDQQNEMNPDVLSQDSNSRHRDTILLENVSEDDTKAAMKSLENRPVTTAASTIHGLLADPPQVHLGATAIPLGRALSNDMHLASAYRLMWMVSRARENTQSAQIASLSNTTASRIHVLPSSRNSRRKGKERQDIPYDDNSTPMQALAEQDVSGLHPVRSKRAVRLGSISATGVDTRSSLLAMTSALAFPNQALLTVPSTFAQPKSRPPIYRESPRHIVNHNQNANDLEKERDTLTFGLGYDGDGSDRNDTMGHSMHDEQFIVSDGDQFEEEDENEEREIRKLRKRIEKIISDELRRYGFQL